MSKIGEGNIEYFYVEKIRDKLSVLKYCNSGFYIYKNSNMIILLFLKNI